MLQAYFDDSKEDGDALIFAGYLATSETWLKFSADWRDLLTMRPKMSPFKMAKAAQSRLGMERAMFHYRAIERAALVGIGCAVPIGPLKKVVKEFSLSEDAEDPYYVAWRAVITLVLEACRMLNLHGPIEFIFDEQSESVNILKAWEYFYSGTPTPVQSRIVGAPSFKSDENILPLQAADMIAWWARKQYVADKRRMRDLFPDTWSKGTAPTLLFAELPEDSIRRIFAKDQSERERRLGIKAKS